MSISVTNKFPNPDISLYIKFDKFPERQGGEMASFERRHVCTRTTCPLSGFTTSATVFSPPLLPSNEIKNVVRLSSARKEATIGLPAVFLSRSRKRDDYFSARKEGGAHLEIRSIPRDPMINLLFSAWNSTNCVFLSFFLGDYLEKSGPRWRISIVQLFVIFSFFSLRKFSERESNSKWF